HGLRARLRRQGSVVGSRHRPRGLGNPAVPALAAPLWAPRRLRSKQRADKVLLDRGLVESRAKAQALIMAGKVFSGDRRIAKAGDLVAEDAPLEVKGQDHPWVSRGGLKLAHALAQFALDPKGVIAIDVGASTGGFTDVLL